MTVKSTSGKPHPLRLVGTRRDETDGTPPRRRGDILGPRDAALYFGVSALLVTAVLLLQGLMLAAHVHINIWWFDSIGLGSVYGTIWNTQRNLFLIFGFLSYGLFTATFFVARALFFRPDDGDAARWIGRAATVAVAALATIVALVMGHTMGDQWQTYLLATHGTSFGTVDPIHHRDLGFYVFTMPWRETWSSYVLAVLILGVVEVAGLAAIYRMSAPHARMNEDTRRVVAIGSLAGAVFFGYLAWRNFYLNPYSLDRPGTAFGGGATFAHASLWWYPIVGTVELLTALALLVNVAVRRVGGTFLAALPLLVAVVASAGQGIFQRFVVAPNELSAEYHYLGYTLQFTRHAYGLDSWRVQEYTPHTLTAADVQHAAATVADARIADSGAFTQVIRQRQENRTYYSFNTADVDRYTVGGTVRQVLIAARELDSSKLSLQAQNWVNERLKYTHGFGLTMTPANTVTRDGQPVLWIQNVPVQETGPHLPPVRQPRIYFGEFSNDWILTGATTPEFDSSQADADTSYRYAGPDGIRVGSGLQRLALSWVEEGGFPFFNKLQISGYVRPTTRILLHRNIFDRIQTIAPWLTLDSNPYPVLRSDGSLVWILDGMTGTDHYPYSEPTNGINYQRNSVKIVIDAYTGRPTFYLFDPSDPIVRAWSGAFPGLLRPMSGMPADIRAHIKYPDDYLDWQAAAYTRYHVTSITSYYNADNQWDIENSQAYSWDNGDVETNQLQPIWTVARLFGEKRDSFYSILPFSVHGKATMAGYIAADNNTYAVRALDMPRGAQTTGATQFESLYSQAPTISSTLTLLDQRGSQVVPGQLLILPVGKALLYIKPLYLRSESSQSLPQLIRVVVGTQNEVNWGYTLAGALNNLLTQGDISVITGSPSSGSSGPAPPPAPSQGTDVYAKYSDTQLIALAEQYYAAAQKTPSLTQKDADLKQVGEILAILRARHPR